MTFKEARELLLEKAQELGVEVEVLTTETRELTLESFEAALSQITQAVQSGVGLRVVVGGKTGYAYTEERSKEALLWALQEAKENAELQTSGRGALPQGRALGRQDLLGESLSAPLEEKAQRALAFESGLRQDPRLKQVMMARYSERDTTVSLASTSGVLGEYRDGLAMLATSVVMQEGESLKQNWDVHFEKEFHSLEPGKTALEITTKAGRLLGAKPMKTGRATAYFEPKAFNQLLSVLLYMLSGKSVMEGQSRLANRVGQRVGSELLTLIDDPLFEGGLGSRPFDSEGTASTKTILVEDGILKGFLHNSETARATGYVNTGHAARGYRSTLGVGPSNFYLKAGEGVALTHGVIVTDLMGLHAGANPISGDVSVQAFGLLVEGGEIAHPVEDFTVSGNLLELLTRIVGLGETLEWHLYGAALGAPMVEVADVSFAGA